MAIAYNKQYHSTELIEFQIEPMLFMSVVLDRLILKTHTFWEDFCHNGSNSNTTLPATWPHALIFPALPNP